MDAELIDLFYKNDSVEGVAVFSEDGTLVESQLALSEDAVSAFGPVFAQIRSDLGGAARDLLGFSIQVDAYLLQIICHGENIFLLQLTKGCSVNEVYLQIGSLLGEPPARKGGRKAPVTTAQQAEPEKAAEPVIGPDDLSWEDYRGDLITLLKRVAPSNLATKMISEAATATGFDESLTHLKIDQAVALGNEAVSRIPNAGRRKLVAKEFATLISKLQS